MPRLSADDVLDFQVKEAMTHAWDKAAKKKQREQEAKAFREDHKSLAKAGH